MMRSVMTMKPKYSSLGHRIGAEDAAEGKFQGWGVEYEEFENGPGNYTVAIVEMADGTVQTLMLWAIRFLDSDQAKRETLDRALANPIVLG